MPTPSEPLKAQWRRDTKLVPSFDDWLRSAPRAELEAASARSVERIIDIERDRKRNLSARDRQTIIKAELRRAWRRVARRSVPLRQWAATKPEGRQWLARKGGAA